VKKKKRNCYINWSQLYNFVTKDYGLTEIGMITKNVLDKFWTVLDMSKTLKINLDMSKRQWELDTMDMSKTSFGHVQLSNITKSNWTCPKPSSSLILILQGAFPKH